MSLLGALGLLVAAGALPGSGAGAADKTPPGDPPGNNGTLKVVASDPSDPDPGNEPKVDGCLIWLEFYGFDQGQTADITFTAQPPSGTRELISQKGVAISDDPAGGGQDKDAVLAYNLTSAVQGLKANKNQGYHIKVRSDTLQAPGGAKQKVFWVKCAPAPTTSLRVTKAVRGTGAGPFGFELRCNDRRFDRTFTLGAGQSHDVVDVPAGTTCVAAETDAKGAASTRVVENPASGPPDGQVKLVARRRATVTFINVFPGGPRAAAAAEDSGQETSVVGAGATAPAAAPPPASTPQAAAALPRTGSDALPLVATGLWSVSVGGLGLAAGRRRRRS
jgi:LPXTG-motif cell wall-anchored protein